MRSTLSESVNESVANSTVFGPVSSRRFGVSLGIDLSPDHKSCNFDCLYCELPKAQKTDTITNPPTVDDVIADVTAALKTHPQTEVLTITANGEPTLYPDLDPLIDALNMIKGNRRLLILSNSSTLFRPGIQKALAKLDEVKLSLDCVTPACFKKIDRPLDITIETIIDSIIAFRKQFNGKLVIEILLVSGINDTVTEFEAFRPVLKEINADRIDVGTIDRPPAYSVKPVPYEKIVLLCENLEGLPVAIATRPGNSEATSYYSKDEILNTFAKRPFSEEDIARLFDQPSQKNLQELLEEKRLEILASGGKKFFHTKKV